MRRLDFVVGLLTVIAFLTSGAYMMFVAHPDSLAPGPHLMYLSRHIYMLAPAMVHLVLSVYASPAPRRRLLRLQWAGTILLVVSAVLLMVAFVVEAFAGQGRTVVSAFGIYTFVTGTLFHVIAPGLSRRRGRAESS